MAKLSLELKDFSGGTITNADLADIPLGAAAYSLNCSPTGALGQIEPIFTDEEIMPNLPAISAMVVRDGLQPEEYHLGVNIGSLFIYIPNYATETKLSDFVEIAERGQLLVGVDPDNISASMTSTEGGNVLGSWNRATGMIYTVIPTIPGYIYSFSGFWSSIVTSGGAAFDGSNVDADSAYFSMNTAAYDSQGAVLPFNNDAHVAAGLRELSGPQYYNRKGMKQWYFTAEKTYSVVQLHISSSSGTPQTDTFEKLRIEFSKGGFLWGLLGENLDLTDTENGLFIGSKTTRPHILHHSRDDKGRLLNYLEFSECKPLISSQAIANIDFFDVIKGQNTAEDVDYDHILCGVYGEKYLWLLARDYDAALTQDFTTFFKSSTLDFAAANGLRGIVKDKDATYATKKFYVWEQQGFNIWECSLDSEDLVVGNPFAVNADKTFSLDINMIPDDGYISSVVQSQNRDDILYVLCTKEGGFGADDNVVFEIDIADTGIKQLSDDSAKVLYKVLPYQSVTAYSNYGYEKNWLGVRNDVNPSGGSNWYWAKTSSSKSTPVAYANGGYADLTLRTAYGDIDDMCWANASCEDISIDIDEQALVCNTIVDSVSGDQDLLTFSVKPLGETIFVTNSGKWRKAEQWPNWWPDGDDPDGIWTNIHTNQTTTDAAMMVSIIPEDLDSVTEAYPALGDDIRDKIIDLEGKMDTLESHPAAPPRSEWPIPIPEDKDNPVLNFFAPSWAWSIIDDVVKSAESLLSLKNTTKYTQLKSAIASGQTDIVICAKARACLDHFIGGVASSYLTNLFGIEPSLLILNMWDDMFSIPGFAWGDLAAGHPSFYGLLVANRNFFGQLAVVAGIDTSVTVDGYSSLIYHREIGASFPLEGGFDSLELATDTTFYAAKIAAGNINITTGTWTFPSEDRAKDKLAGSTLSWSDEIGMPSIGSTNVPNGNNIFPIEESIWETEMDSSGNITRTKTEDQAAISEFVMKPVTGNTIITNQSSSGSATNMEIVDSTNTNGLLVALYTGDLIVRSYAEGHTGTINSANDPPGYIYPWVASPFDSGDISVGITPSDGIAAQEFEEDAEGTATTDKYTATFEINSTVYYNMSFLYDGYQEGPLMNTAVTHKVDTTHGCDTMNLQLNIGTFNPRITAVQVYRKNDPREKYRLVKQVELNNEWTIQPAIDGVEDANLSATAFMQSGITTSLLDEGKKGISYEALTGMPETLTDTIVDYSESEPLNGYLFVCNAKHKHVDNAEKFIFRSQAGKFSIFNWSQDYIGLPERVHTLKAAYNRLYAFSSKTMYQIDPHAMIVEAVHDGFGIAGQSSVAIADGTMYIANKNGVYIFGGGKFKLITQTIQDLWDDITVDTYPAAIPILANDKKYNSLLVMFTSPGTVSGDNTPRTAFAFSIDKRRWDIWELPERIKAVCMDGDNNLLLSGLSSAVASINEFGEGLNSDGEEIGRNTHSIWKLHRGLERKEIKWLTKELTMEQDTRDKKFKRVKLIGSNVYISKIIIDDVTTDLDIEGRIITYDEVTGNWTPGEYAYLQTDSTVRYINLMKFPKSINIKGKKIQIEAKTQANSAGTGSEVKNITVIYNWRTLK